MLTLEQWIERAKSAVTDDIQPEGKLVADAYEADAEHEDIMVRGTGISNPTTMLYLIAHLLHRVNELERKYQ